MAAIELIDTTFYTDSALKGYWRLENVNDSSPSGYNLTNNGTTTFSAAKFNNGASLNGSSQWLSITNASAPNLYTTGDQTIVAWVNPTNFTTTQSIFSNANASVNTGLSFQVDVTTGLLNFRSFKTGDDQSVTSSGALSAGSQNLVAVSYTSSGQAVRLHVNGTDTTGTFSRALVATTGDTAIGRLGSSSGQYFLGLVDDCAWFNRALSSAELLAIYNGTSPLFTPKVLFI